MKGEQALPFVVLCLIALLFGLSPLRQRLVHGMGETKIARTSAV